MSHKLLGISCVLISLPSFSMAQGRPRSTSTFTISIDGVVAQVADGEYWKTIITLVNVDSTVGTYTISFYADNGSPLVLQTTDGTGAAIAGTLPVGGSHVIETAGTKATLSQGWARIATSNNISGIAIFRQSLPGNPQVEASMPVIVYVEDNDYLLPFDHIMSSTGVAVVNPLSYTAITVFVTFRDEQGNVFFKDSFSLGPLQHTAFTLSDRYPQSNGRRGVVELLTPGLTMNVLGLRYGPSLTSILPLTR